MNAYTYTWTHPATGRPICTRTVDGDRMVTHWHPSGRVTRERAVQVGETVDGEPTYVWMPETEGVEA